MASKKKTKQQASQTTAIVEVQAPPTIEAEEPTQEQPREEAAIPVEESQVPAPPTRDALAESPVEVPTPTDEAPLPQDNAEAETPVVVTPSDEIQEAKPASAKKGKAKPEKGSLSAINTAARVLARKGEPMSCKELIGVMALRGLWTSPGGKTPASTLYAAISREIQVEGEASRFVKVGRGLFAINPNIVDSSKSAKKPAKADAPNTEVPDPTERMIPDGSEGPQSLKELFRI